MDLLVVTASSGRQEVLLPRTPCERLDSQEVLPVMISYLDCSGVIALGPLGDAPRGPLTRLCNRLSDPPTSVV
jgi:hypothetical protein